MNVPIRLYSAIHPHCTASTTTKVCLCWRASTCCFVCACACVCASVVKCVGEMYFYCTIYLCLACTPAFTVRLQLITCLCCAVPRGGHGILLLRELLCVGQSGVGPSFAAVVIIVPPTAAWWRLKMVLLGYFSNFTIKIKQELRFSFFLL